MDQQRAQTLQALQAFIDTQRQLLERQRSDIHKLQCLRLHLVERPAQILANLSNELDDPAFRLSEQADCRLTLPKDIHWSAFEKSDTTHLRTFALTQTQHASIPSNGCPATTQPPNPSPTLSDLHKLVKSARRAIVDPVLEQFKDMSPEPELAPRSFPLPASQSKDPAAATRAIEREKIKELRERMIRRGGCGLSVRLSCPLVLPEDDAMDVDVDVMDNDVDGEPAATSTATESLMNVDKRRLSHSAARNALAGPKRKRTARKEEHARGKRVPLPLPGESDHDAQANSNDANSANDADCTSMPPPPPRIRIRIRIPLPSSNSHMQNGKGEEPSSSKPALDDAFGPRSGFAPEREQERDQADTPDEEVDEDDEDESEEDVDASSTSTEYHHPSKPSKSKPKYDEDDEDESEEDEDASSTSNEYYHPSKSSKSKPKSMFRTKPKTKTKTKTKTTKTRTKIKHPKPPKPKLPKPKPETYNQAWSVEEQNLLEQLLDEVKDGERFRWQKISQAMGGRRTPRQVASRVQKYLEKLKKFGVDM